MKTPNEIINDQVEQTMSFWAEHRYMLLIISTISIAIVLVITSLAIYNLSGASQLDLSRPGYRAVGQEVDKTEFVEDYSTFGPINKTTVDEFTKLYDAQAAKAKAVDAFNGDPLNPEVLEADSAPAQE